MRTRRSIAADRRRRGSRAAARRDEAASGGDGHLQRHDLTGPGPAGGQDTNATSIGNRIPTVWTDRQHGSSSARPSGHAGRPARPGSRTARDSATHASRHRPRGRSEPHEGCGFEAPHFKSSARAPENIFEAPFGLWGPAKHLSGPRAGAGLARKIRTQRPGSRPTRKMARDNNTKKRGNYDSGEDYVLEYGELRFTFNEEDFRQRVEQAAVKLSFVEARASPPRSSTISSTWPSTARSAKPPHRSASTSTSAGTSWSARPTAHWCTGCAGSCSAAPGWTSASRKASSTSTSTRTRTASATCSRTATRS